MNYFIKQFDKITKYVKCELPVGELLCNYTFDCGVQCWGENPLYPSVITDNRDGSVHVKATSIYGGIAPLYKQVLEPGEYECNVNVQNLIGSGRVKWKSDAWYNTGVDVVEGLNTYAITINDTTNRFELSAMGDDTLEFDILEFSLKKTANVVALDMDNDGLRDDLIFGSEFFNVSEDADSVNIDLDGDKVADIIIPK